MPFLDSSSFFAAQAQVLGVDTESRTITIQWLNMETTSSGVICTGPNTDYSLPRVGNIGLV